MGGVKIYIGACCKLCMVRNAAAVFYSILLQTFFLECPCEFVQGPDWSSKNLMAKTFFFMYIEFVCYSLAVLIELDSQA